MTTFLIIYSIIVLVTTLSLLIWIKTMTNKPDFMNRFIYSEFMDEIIQYRLKILIDDTVESIREYKAKDNLNPHQQADLDQWLKDIKYFTDTYIYFSGQYNYRPEFYDE